MNRKYQAIFCILYFVFSFYYAIPLHAQSEEKPILVKVNPAKVLGNVSQYVINGFNFNNSMQVYTIKDKIARLGINTITAPGGDIGERDELKPADMEFFKQQQGYLANPLTFMQIKLRGGGKELAVSYIKLAKEYNARIDYWTIGNEPDLFAKTDTSWTMAKYNSMFREYVTAMKAYDPKIMVTGPAVSQPKDDWVRSFIYDCGDLVDVLTWHWYPSKANWSDAAAIRTAKDCLPMIERYRALLKDPKTNPKGHMREIKLGLTEWAVHPVSDNSRHITDMTGVLWSAEVLAQIAQSGIDFAHYFCLNQWGHAIFNKLNSPRPLFYMFAMFTEHFGTQVIESKTGDEELFASASKKGDAGISIFLVNESPEKRKTVIVAFDGVSRIEGAAAYELTESVKYGEIKADRIKSVRKSVQLDLSPFSVTVLEAAYK